MYLEKGPVESGFGEFGKCFDGGVDQTASKSSRCLEDPAG